MKHSLVCGHPNLFGPVTEWETWLRSLEQRGDPEQDWGLRAAIDQAKRVIASNVRQDAHTRSA